MVMGLNWSGTTIFTSTHLIHITYVPSKGWWTFLKSTPTLFSAGILSCVSGWVGVI